MTKLELLKVLRSKFPDLSKDDVEVCVNLIMDQIAVSIAQKMRVEIRGFGVFYGSLRKAKMLRNPKTAEPFWSEGRFVPRFKPSKQLIDLGTSVELDKDCTKQPLLRAA